MNLFITLIIGIILAFVIHKMDMITKKKQGTIFSCSIYALEIFLCIIRRRINIYANNTFISVIVMLILPFLILFAYYTISELIKKNSEQKN